LCSATPTSPTKSEPASKESLADSISHFEQIQTVSLRDLQLNQPQNYAEPQTFRSLGASKDVASNPNSAPVSYVRRDMMDSDPSLVEAQFNFETCPSFPDEPAIDSYSDGYFSRNTDAYLDGAVSFDRLALENEMGIEDQVFKTKNDGNKALRLW
jgi:hypothetical protein